MPGGPYFIGVGAQKSGTTWLASYLQDHAEVGMTPLKELHYWTSKHSPHQRNSVRGFSAARIRGPLMWQHIQAHPLEAPKWLTGYLGLMAHSDRSYRHFLDMASHGKVITGEFTPDYASLSADVVHRIDTLLNKPRYIFIMRNPADRFISQIGQEAFHIDKSTMHADPVRDLLPRPNFAFNSDYRRTIETYQSIAGPGRFHMMFFEDLFDPIKGQSVCDSLCDYLGISQKPAPISARSINSGRQKPTTVDRAALVEALRPTYDYCAALFDGKLPASWLADLDASLRE